MKYLVLLLGIVSSINAQATIIKIDPTLPTIPDAGKVSVPPAAKNTSVCYKYVGCFNNYPPFDNAGGVLPSPPERVGTKIILYTTKNKIVAQQVDWKDKGATLKATNFNPLYQTKILIHGFTQDERELWLHTMKDALLTTGPLNVFIVGWQEGAELPDYPRAVANTRLVAVQVKLFIDGLLMQGASLNQIHLIGHSLGAHISGYVGEYFNGQIARISGMDPAGPFFEGTDETVRLNPSDAQFVDVIHSNAVPIVDGGAGMFAPCGHVDFYPNGGRYQPGCPGLFSGSISKIFALDFSGVSDVASCSHGRSHQLYIESIVNEKDCRLRSNPCTSWEDYNAGKCNSCGEHGCSEMGYHSIEYAARGKFYLVTKGAPVAEAADGDQFCGIIYNVVLSPANRDEKIKGAIELHITGSQSKVDASFQGSGDTLSGDTKIIVVDYAELGDLKSIGVTYKRSGGFFFGWGSGSSSWKLDHVIISHLSKEFRFCEKSPVDIKDGETVVLNRCN